MPTFDVSTATKCDAKAYCSACDGSTKCSYLLKEAHAGDVSGVLAVGSGSDWHAYQALALIENLHETCEYARDEGLINATRRRA